MVVTNRKPEWLNEDMDLETLKRYKLIVKQMRSDKDSPELLGLDILIDGKIDRKRGHSIITETLADEENFKVQIYARQKPYEDTTDYILYVNEEKTRIHLNSFMQSFIPELGTWEERAKDFKEECLKVVNGEYGKDRPFLGWIRFDPKVLPHLR